MVTHIVPKSGKHSATLVAYAEPTKFKLLAVGSRGLGAVKLCVHCPLLQAQTLCRWLPVNTYHCSSTCRLFRAITVLTLFRVVTRQRDCHTKLTHVPVSLHETS